MNYHHVINKMCLTLLPSFSKTFFFFFFFPFALLLQGQVATEAQGEAPTEILVPVCLKPEEGLEVWRLWVKRKNAELSKRETTKLAPIGRK